MSPHSGTRRFFRRGVPSDGIGPDYQVLIKLGGSRCDLVDFSPLSTRILLCLIERIWGLEHFHRCRSQVF